jgi:hypothetical protein
MDLENEKRSFKRIDSFRGNEKTLQQTEGEVIISGAA